MAWLSVATNSTFRILIYYNNDINNNNLFNGSNSLDNNGNSNDNDFITGF